MDALERKEIIKSNKLIYFNRFRAFFYEWTDMKAYQKIIVSESVVSFIYQSIIMIMAICASVLIYYNNVDYQNPDLNKVYFVKDYFKVYYVFNFIFLIDYLIRWFHADYTYNSISRLKAFLLYPFRFINALDFASFLIIVVLYNIGLNDLIYQIENANDQISVFSSYQQIINNTGYKDIIPIAFVVKILGIHSKIIRHTIISSETKVFSEVIKRRWRILLSSIIIIITFTFLLSFIILKIEQRNYQELNILITDPSYKFKNLGDALWFAMGTITTIAYGDITPISSGGKAFGVLLGVIGVTYYGFLTSLFASGIISIIGDYVRTRDNNRLIAFQTENERLLHEFSEKIKVEIVEELIKTNLLNNNKENEDDIKKIDIDYVENIKKEISKNKSKTRKKLYFSEETFDDRNRASNFNIKIRKPAPIKIKKSNNKKKK